MRTSIVLGLGFGDEGKGSWVDHLVRKQGARYVVRYNGGAQAMHHVVETTGRVHRYAQFGSGMFVPDTFTMLSRFMLIEPEALLSEARELEDNGVEAPLARMIVSENAPVITPFNRILNRMQEVARGGERHGSCGFGIGITQGDVETLGSQALYVRDFQSSDLRQKLEWLAEQKAALARRIEHPATREMLSEFLAIDLEYYERLYADFYSQVRVVSEAQFREILRENETVFEGAQGTLLDQSYGFFPHVTRSNCTFENAELLLAEAGFAGDIERVGLLRGYGTRHGAGPFVTEDRSLELPACHNGTNAWQGSFRLGWFDAVAARYALEAVGGVDTLAITNLDRMSELAEIKVGVAYGNVDSRFFEADRIPVVEPDLRFLERRTAALSKATPVYEIFPGFGQEMTLRAVERYLETLSELIGTPVTACSLSADDQKVYLDTMAMV